MASDGACSARESESYRASLPKALPATQSNSRLLARDAALKHGYPSTTIVGIVSTIRFCPHRTFAEEDSVVRSLRIVHETSPIRSLLFNWLLPKQASGVENERQFRPDMNERGDDRR